MAIKARFIVQNQTGGRVGEDYYEDLEAAMAACETLNGGLNNPERDGYVVAQVFVGDWSY